MSKIGYQCFFVLVRLTRVFSLYKNYFFTFLFLLLSYQGKRQLEASRKRTKRPKTSSSTETSKKKINLGDQGVKSWPRDKLVANQHIKNHHVESWKLFANYLRALQWNGIYVKFYTKERENMISNQRVTRCGWEVQRSVWFKVKFWVRCWLWKWLRNVNQLHTTWQSRDFKH